jgi:hypothetical protein
MRLPRMTTRRWMVAVAVVALVLGAVQLKRRRDDLLSGAQSHAQVEQKWRQWEALERRALQAGEVDANPSLAAWVARRISYHRTMARKYRHAARFPWLPVGPDPPSPP